jgi:hypothetical protein
MSYRKGNSHRSSNGSGASEGKDKTANTDNNNSSNHSSDAITTASYDTNGVGVVGSLSRRSSVAYHDSFVLIVLDNNRDYKYYGGSQLVYI